MLSHETDVLSPSHRPQNCCLLLVVLDALACQEGTAAVAKLKKMWKCVVYRFILESSDNQHKLSAT